jgi:hypothetical protein
MSIRQILLSVLCGLAVFAGARPLASGQTGASETAATPAPKRWLIIVETSTAMQRRKEGTVEVTRDLLRSEMDGQLTPGDTIGVWTFDNALHTGKLPTQKWPQSEKPEVALKVASFIESHPFDGSPDLNAIVAPINGVAAKSDLLTVLLISSGQGEISGTPFDAPINEAWAVWRKEKSKRPLVTILRAVEGKLVQQYVTPADYAVEMPPLPKLPEPKPQPPAAKPAVTNTHPPPSTPAQTAARAAPAGPLIFSGPNKKTPPGITISGVPQTNATEPPKPTVAAVAGTNPATASQTATTAANPPAPSTGKPGTNVPLAVVHPVVQSTPPPPPVDEPKLAASNPPSAAVNEPAPPEPFTTEPAASPAWSWLWIFAGGAMAVIGLLTATFILIRRRGSSGPSGSIISRSYDDHDP